MSDDTTWHVDGQTVELKEYGDQYVVYETGGRVLRVLLRSQWDHNAKPGPYTRPLPKLEGSRTPAIIPVWETKGNHATEYAIPHQIFSSVEAVKAEAPSSRLVGYLKVPLDWSKAEWM